MIINLAMNEPGAYYKMPLVGITETRARVNSVTLVQYTVRCGNQNCWWVGHASTTDDSNLLLHDHQTTNGACPAPPARNELPSGYSTIEKLWDELDDVTAAIIENRPWATGGMQMQGEMLKGYARGLCFNLSMLTHPFFRTTKDVVSEAMKRYKIRTNQIPFEPTPTYRDNPTLAPASPPVGEKQAYHGATVPAKPVTRTTRAARTAAKKALEPTKDLAKLTAQQANKIRETLATGFFSAEDLAKMYGVSVEAIKAIGDKYA